MYLKTCKGQQHKPYNMNISASLEEAVEKVNANQLSRKQVANMFSKTGHYLINPSQPKEKEPSGNILNETLR
jgi:hypothetical protein